MEYATLPTQRALLVWQPPLQPLEEGGRRDRRAVGQLVRESDGNVSFRYSRNGDMKAAREEGFDGYPGLPIWGRANNRVGFEVLRRRLPSTEREDFSEMLERRGLPAEFDREDHLTLMAYTGARQVTDSFSICETFDGFDEPFTYMFDLANIRRDGNLEVCAKLHPGEEMEFVREEDNKYDPNAIKVVRKDGRERAGYINRIQAKTVGQWVDEARVKAKVFKFNGRAIYPRLFVRAYVVP